MASITPPGRRPYVEPMEFPPLEPIPNINPEAQSTVDLMSKNWRIDPENYLNTFMNQYNKLMGGLDIPQFGAYSPGGAGLGMWSPGQAGLGQFSSDLLNMTSDQIMQNLMNPKYSQQMGVIRDWTTGASQAEQDRLMDMYAGMGGRTAPQAAQLSMMQNQASQQQAPLMKQAALDIWNQAAQMGMGMGELQAGIYSDAKKRELQNAAMAGDAYANAKLRELQNAELSMKGMFGAYPYQAGLYGDLLGAKTGALGTLSNFLQNTTGNEMAAQQQSFGNLGTLAGQQQQYYDLPYKKAQQAYPQQLQQYAYGQGFRQQPQQQQPLSNWLSR